MKFNLWILTICMVIGSAGIIPAGAAISMSPDNATLSESGQTKTMDAGAQAAAQTAYEKLPMRFEANKGQTADAVKYLARGKGYTVYLTSSEAVLALQVQSEVVRVGLEGARAGYDVRGLDMLPGRSNYLIGNDSAKWQTGVEQYSRVSYEQVYPGIDMIYYGDQQGSLAYDFVVAPGANPDLIRLDFQGAKNLELDEQGNLVLNLKEGRIAFSAPVLFQETGDVRDMVEGRFVLAGNNQVGFEVGAYDENKELIIDPSLMYSTYLGGTVEDRVNDIALDTDGNIYLTGFTVSADFPAEPDEVYNSTHPGGTAAFVTKISTAGELAWSTYFGGAAIDIARGIAVSDEGIIHIVGATTSDDLPTVNPHQAENAGGTDAFVTAFSTAADSLVYSTYLGGAGTDEGHGIAVDGDGNAYVTGGTTSNDTTFPQTPGAYQSSNAGDEDAFVSKFYPAGNIAYSTFLGGTARDRGRAIAVDGIGNAYVAGQAADAFPIVPLSEPTAFKTTISGAYAAFISKISPTGEDLLYSTYVGGSGIDDAFGIALDGADPASLNAYITGYTFSADFPDIGFATVGQTTIGGAPSAYVFKLNMNGGGGHNDGVFSTFLGGSGDDRARSIKVDEAGNSYVTGRTESGDFPMVNPIEGTLIGTGMVFVTEIDKDPAVGQNPVFSTYLGGVTDQAGTGVSLDSSANIYVGGWTSSTDYTTTTTATMGDIIQDENPGSFSGFFSKISAPSPLADPLPVITSVNPAGGVSEGGTTVVIGGSAFDGVTSVKFDGVEVGTMSFTVDSNTQITATSPAGTPGKTVHIVAASPAGSSLTSEDSQYTYFSEGIAPTISSLKPDRGPAAGGTTVVITGTGFSEVNESFAGGVKFGALNAASYVVNSDSKITAITKAHELGIVDVVVTSLTGSSEAESYTYFAIDDDYPYIFPSPTRGDEAGIAYNMEGPGRVSARIYNEIGNLVYTMAEESRPSGVQGSTINVGSLAPGVYFCILKVEYDDGSSEKYSRIKFAVIH